MTLLYVPDIFNIGICIHEFFKHQDYDIPWWICLDEECEEHWQETTHGHKYQGL